MKHSKNLFFTFFLIIYLSPNFCHALPINIDGSVDDWGINPASSQWIPGETTVVKDTTGTATGAYAGISYSIKDGLSWQFGGQAYDAEAAYLYLTDEDVYLAIVTGFPHSGRNIRTSLYRREHIDPGDIALAFTSDPDFDPLGDGYQYGIKTKKSQSYSLYSAQSWARGSYYPRNGVTFMTQESYLGGIDLNYSRIGRSSHYLIEAQIARDLFPEDEWEDNKLIMHWAMGCGNDHIEVGIPIPHGGPHVPEPATLVLMGTGLILMGMLGCLKMKKKA